MMPAAVAVARPPTLDLVLSPPQAEFVLDNQHKFLAMVGGRGCVAGATLINGVPAAERTTARGPVETLWGPAAASPSYCKGAADLYHVQTQYGRNVSVTLHHRFLTPTGWRPLGDLKTGELIAAQATPAERDAGRLPCSRFQPTPYGVEDPVSLLHGVSPCDGAFWDPITRVRFDAHAQYYDLSVPLYEHYAAAGLWHHNSGKSHAGCLKDILFLLEYPGAEMMIAAPNHPWLRDTTRKTFFEILATFPGGASAYIKAYNKTENVVWFQNGSIGYFRSMDNPDTIRGLNLAAGHIDEAGYVSHRAWEVFKACLRQGGGYPLQGWITTTPTGYNWIWEEWDQKPTSEHRLIKAPTRTNRFLPDPEKFIADLGYEGTFRAQEVEGEFVSFEGLVYPTFDPSQRGGHVRRVELGGPKPKRVLAGVDWGFKDPAVILVVADMGDGVYWILEEWYETKKTADEIAAAAFDLYLRYGIEGFYCDPSRPDSLLTLSNRLALPIVHEANNDILTGIQAVTALLKKRGDGLYGLYVDPSCTRIIAEFSKYQYPDEKSPEQTSGRRTKNAGEKPLDKDNHVLDCARYIAMAVDPGLGRKGFGAHGTKEGWF
jgi:phage terminase large subunit